MLLYSTTLQINDSLSKDGFIELVIEWNQSSPHAENIIPNIRWDGEHNIRFGNELLWLDIEEYRNKNTIAIRFEKREDDGAIWDTDYIMNFDTMTMTIQLDRGYTEDALMEDLKFSSPHFISMLIDGGYLQEDNGVPILRQETLIDESNIPLLADVINGDVRYRLPVVYVSKTLDNNNPVNVSFLCRKLKGIAHVFLQDDKRSNWKIRTACNDHNEYFGGVGVYFPNGKHRRFLYRKYAGSDNLLLDKVTRAVLQYMNAQKKPILSTWAGVNNALLTDRYVSKKEEKDEAEQARQKAESDVETYIGAFDEDIAKLHNQIEALTRKNNSLQLENQGLRAKLSGMNELPIIFLGDEEEFFPGEIKEMVLDAVADSIEKVEQNTRRRDVLNDILQNNDYRNIREERKQLVKNLLKGYSTMSGPMRQQLKNLGLEISEDGKHYKLTYYGDNRYKSTMAKTGSDHREGSNIANAILKIMM